MIVYIKKEFADIELLWGKPYVVHDISINNTKYLLIKNEFNRYMAYYRKNFLSESEYKSIDRENKLNGLL